MKNFYRKSLLFITAVGAFTAFSGVALAAVFSDVPATNDYYLAVKYLQEQGIVKGYEDGTFKPDNILNRAESMKFVLESNKTTLPTTVTSIKFPDVKLTDWFIKYLSKAVELGIVEGNPDGTFAPAREVTKAEFVKMLLNANGFKTEKWAGQNIYPDVPVDAWFAPYMNYAGQSGILTEDENGNLNPSKPMSRGQVSQSVYLLKIILSGKDTQFLLDQAELQMTQIETYIGASKPASAKNASQLAVDFSQQAYKNLPTDSVVLGAAKLARAYDYLVNAYLAALAKDYGNAYSWAQQAIAKATEAWEANHDIQSLARHIKDRANEIISQLPQSTQQSGTQLLTQQSATQQ